MELCKKIRSGELNWIRFFENGVGRTRIDDETKRIAILGDSKHTIDDTDGSLEANHVQIPKTTNELQVLMAGGAESSGTRLATCRSGAEKKLRRRVTMLEMRREKIQKLSCTCH